LPATPSHLEVSPHPNALAGRDVLGRAETGSGKTLAFGLPLLVRTATASGRRRAGQPRGLVLVPTRELADQVHNELASRPGRTLVFVRTKHRAARPARQLDRAGLRAGALHGDLAQPARAHALAAFAAVGSVVTLVLPEQATEVANLHRRAGVAAPPLPADPTPPRPTARTDPRRPGGRRRRRRVATLR
jgi:superfamily II DNA/RNA helicase